MDIAQKYNLYVIEDAAQGVMSTYKGQALGSIGDYGCYSFHETKNYSMGEGGALLIKNEDMIEPAEIIREKGTNRSKFFRGQIDKYTWVNYGSSYLPSELNAAYLYAELECAEEINKDRLASWEKYYYGLSDLQERGYIELPVIPDGCQHNAHMFYIKAGCLAERTKLIKYLKDHEISTVFHYIPLHSSPAGIKFGRFSGKDIFTTKESERLVRLPMYFLMSNGIVCDIMTWNSMQYSYVITGEAEDNPSIMFRYYKNIDNIPDKYIYIDFGRDKILSCDNPTFQFNK